MQRRLPLLLTLAALGCAGRADETIDRSALDLGACASGSMSPFGQLSPAEPVDYLELRGEWGSEAAIGDRCGSASDRALCEAAYGALIAPSDSWAMRPDGGAPAPRSHLAYTRGDDVGVVGLAGLTPFLLPIDGVFDAAFLAQIATQGVVDCASSAGRAVPGGHEIVTRRTGTCGGAVDDFLVFVGEDGATTIVAEASIRSGEAILCP